MLRLRPFFSARPLCAKTPGGSLLLPRFPPVQGDKTDMPGGSLFCGQDSGPPGFRGEQEDRSSALTVFLKHGEDEPVGKGVQAVGNEDAKAYIRQEVSVHVDPVIAEYDDPDDCEGKEQLFEIRFFACKYVCQHGKRQHDRGFGHVAAGPGSEGALIPEIRNHLPPVAEFASGIGKGNQILIPRAAADDFESDVDKFAEYTGEQDHGTDGEQQVRVLIVEDPIRKPCRQAGQGNPSQVAEHQEEEGAGLPGNIAVSLAQVFAACIEEAVKRPEQGIAQQAPRQGVESAPLFPQALEQAHASDGIEQMRKDIAVVLIIIADGGLVGKRNGNLVIVKAADDDSDKQSKTDHIKSIGRHSEYCLFCHIITPFHDL